MDDGEVAASLHVSWSSGMDLQQENGEKVVEGGLEEYDDDLLYAHLTQLAQLVEKNQEVAVRNITFVQSKVKKCRNLKHKGVYYKRGSWF